MTDRPRELVELKPCPFCGSTSDAPIERVVHVTFDELSTHPYGVQCDGCGAFIGSFESEEEAIAAWNTRPTPTSEQTELVERARKIALAGEGAPDDLGGEIVTMTLRNPDGPELLGTIEALSSIPTSNSALHVVFDGPPGHESGRFVECETPDGRSINAGQWHERGDGLWELRIPALPASNTLAIAGEALSEARKAIASLPEDALGMAMIPATGEGGNGYAYPIRDELLTTIDKALSSITEEKGE